MLPINGFLENEVHINFKNDLIEDTKISERKKKALIAAGLSAVIPGIGQLYLGEKIGGMAYLIADASIWLTRDYYLDEVRKSSELYKQYVRDHWSISKWIRDYYNPTMLGIAENGIAEPDEVYIWFFDDSTEDSYQQAWDHSHYAEFYYEDTVISTSDEVNFKDIYEDICNASVDDDYICFLRFE